MEQEKSIFFGMTEDEIIVAADTLCQQKDKNHPTESESYAGFIKAQHAGREMLKNQKGYYQNG
jgi:hypothetical protein